MSGLAAVAADPSRAGGLPIGRMLDRMAHYPWLEPLSRPVADGVAVGLVTLPHMAPSACVASADGRRYAVIHGEIFASDAERRRLAGTEDARSVRSDAALLLAGWMAGGDAFLASLNGEFAAVVWDGSRGELLVVTDRFGLRPVYVATSDAGFAAASEIKAVLELPGVDTAWSEAGVAQFFSFGHFIADDTLFAGVRAVPAATIATYRTSDGQYAERAYWTLRPGVVNGSPADLTRALDDRLTEAVARRAQPGEHLGLSLSGGLDARTILGLMPAGLDLKTVSLGIDGSLDHRSASRLAALSGVAHRAFVLDADFLSTFEPNLREMVRLTDGHYLDQGIVMPTMAVYRELGIDYLLRGHGGELLHMTKAYAFSVDPAALRADDAGIRDWLFTHLTAYMLGAVPPDLFTFDVRDRARQSLDEALARCGPVARPVDRVWRLFLRERLHRETPLSMHTFGCFATVRQPFMDNDVIDVLFSMPPELKLDDALQAAILAHRRPAFLTVTNANTGARVGAGRLVTEAARFRMRVFAKLGVKGYQPYERLGLWLRRELRPLVESTLTGGPLMESGIVRPDVLRRVVRQHVDQEANHTFLLMALMIFGMGMGSAAK
ncbi:MAG: hypothetical protein IT184_09925 [Acidobacteria bacterium]|nr:hypothetical protein [Acidobacteriota bacterium]